METLFISSAEALGRSWNLFGLGKVELFTVVAILEHNPYLRMFPKYSF
jgi:hypothetical protein